MSQPSAQFVDAVHRYLATASRVGSVTREQARDVADRLYTLAHEHHASHKPPIDDEIYDVPGGAEGA